MSTLRPAAFALFLSCLTASSSTSRATDIAKGADVGWLQQMTDPGQPGGPFQFYDTDGLQRDPDQTTNCLKLLKERGIDTIRLRVFVPPVVDPHWDNQLYGHCTVQEIVPIAVAAHALGLRISIDLHYSWTFADPGSQKLPVDWANAVAGKPFPDALDTLAREVGAHTTDVLTRLKAAGVTPEWVQIGNEITNGMLMHVQNVVTVPPATRTSPNYGRPGPGLARLVNAGYDAVKAVDPRIKVVVHIDRAHNDSLNKWFFNTLKANGGKWDVSGTDTFGGTYHDIQATVNDLAASFEQPGAGGDGVMMCEIEPTTSLYDAHGKYDPAPHFDQATRILNIMRAVPNGKGVGALYWEPEADPDWRGYQFSAFANHEPSSVLDAFRPAILRTSGTSIIGGDGQPLQLRGVNLGGWLVMEPWMTPADSSKLPDEYSILQTLDRRFGVSTEQSLIKTYRQSWITAPDLDNIRAQGLNVVRVPVWWGDFYPLSVLDDDAATAPAMRPDAFELLDWLVQQASERGIYTVIDMHGVFGGQSAEVHTGQPKKNQFWTNPRDQARTQAMWSALAAHFRGNAWIAGYDLLNEPTGAPNDPAVVNACKTLYAAIRAVDPDHIIFVEGTWNRWNWSMLPDPASVGWTNVVYEMHEYHWSQQTPAAVEAGADAQVSDFKNHQSYRAPAFLGEFNAFGTGTDAWRHVVEAYDHAGMSWSSWSYKATHGNSPDSWGLYDPNGKWTTVPNVATDAASTIAADWSRWTTADAFALNPMVSTVLVGPPAITSVSQSAVASSAAFRYTITASARPTSFAATDLPPGMSLDAATGVISGTPPANGGTFRIGLSAVTGGGTCAGALRLTVVPAANFPVITSADAAGGEVGRAFRYVVAAKNRPASFGAAGLPTGLAINSATGVISGEPTAAGQTRVTLSATNASGTATQELALTIAPRW